MFPFSLLITPFTVFLSLSTASGVFIHDMRIDKVAATALAIPAVVASYQASKQVVNFASDLHTHAEAGSLRQVAGANQSPLIQPRSAHKNKKYLTKRSSLVGHKALYGSTILINHL